MKTCRQIHHGRREKANNAHVGNTGDTATYPGSTATEKNKLTLNHQPWCKLKKKDLPVWRCGGKSPSHWSNPIMACLHVVLSLHGPVRLASPRLPCALYMSVRNAASDAKVVSHVVQICSVDTALPSPYPKTVRREVASTRSVHHCLPRCGELDPDFVPGPRICAELWKVRSVSIPPWREGRASP